jgi:hypothetical protein
VEAAVAALDGLARVRHRSTGAWKLAQVLEHAAQSVEYSISGFPSMKPAAFRATLGAAAFAVFDARGAMSHALDEPIPGAPELVESPLNTAVMRLKSALAGFAAHRGALMPHFAYGELSHAQYTRAHLMHLANHWSEVVRA